MNSRYEVVTRNIRTLYVYRLISLLSEDWKRREEKGINTMHYGAYLATCIGSGLITRNDIKEYLRRCKDKSARYDIVPYHPFTEKLEKIMCKRFNITENDLSR